MVAYTVDAKFINRFFFPDYPGKCYDNETNAAYEVGETWSKTGNCGTYTCIMVPGSVFLNVVAR
jgi:hypothetical protein